MIPDMHISSGTFEIEITCDIEKIRGDWKKLEVQGLSTPFQTQAWLVPFYEVLAPALNFSPLFVLVRENSGHKPVMLFLLCIRRSFGANVIEFADLGVSDYNAPLIASDFDFASLTWKVLWGDILRGLKGSSILRLEKMPPHIGGRPNPLTAHSPKARLMDISSWGVFLPASFTEYAGHVLNQTFARELAKKKRRVAKRGKIEYTLAQTVQTKRAVFEILVRQRQERCDEMGRFNILASPAHRRFYEAVAIESAGVLAGLGRLHVGEEIVATVLALTHQGAVHVLMSTYQSGEWKSCSLGNIVIQSAVEHAIGHGINFFDLTIGNENYKQHFGAKPTALYTLTHSLTPAGAAIVGMQEIGVWIKKSIKFLLGRAQRTSRSHTDDG